MSLRRSVRYNTVLPAFIVIIVIFSFVMTNLIFTAYQRMKACDPEPYVSQETMDGIVLRNQILHSDLNKCRAGERNELIEITKYLREDVNQLILLFSIREARTDRVAAQQVKLAGRNVSVSESKIMVNQELFNYMANVLKETPYPGVETYTQYATARLRLLPLTGVNPLIPSFGQVINDVLSFQYPLTIASCPDKPIGRSVFIAVISACANVDKRNTIRHTWKKHLDVVQQKGLLTISGFAFILGQPESNAMQQQIQQESNIHEDIIQIGMADYYTNLPLKDAGLLNWLNNNCATLDFLAKVDDDLYINAHNLVHFVQVHYQSHHSVFGFGHYGTSVLRKDSVLPEYAKWTLTFEEYPWSTYPDYMRGLAYLLHGSTIRPLLAACQTTPMIPLEDIYLTGMCGEKAGVKMQYSVGLARICKDLSDSVPTACEIHKYMAWPSDDLLQSNVAFENFYSLNKTHCKTISSDGIYRTVDPQEPVHFQFTQARKS